MNFIMRYHSYIYHSIYTYIFRKEKELIKGITTFEKENRSLYELKQENETLLENIEFLKEENANLQVFL